MKAGPALVLLARETRDLLRDRKALAAALLVPLALYPVLLLFTGRLLSPGKPPAPPHSVLTALSEDLEEMAPLLMEEGFVPEPGAPLTARAVKDQAVDLVLLPGKEPGLVRALLDGRYLDSRKIRARLERVLGRWRSLKISRAVSRNPEARKLVDRFRLEEVSFPVAEKGSAGALALIPLALLLALLSGSAFAALDLLPGEKERGTLETLLVQPLSTGQVVLAKYAALLLPGLAALAAGVLSVWAAPLLAGKAESAPVLGTGQVLVVFALSLPAAFLLAALLFWVSALARSFREGQHYLLPLTLGVMVPGGLALSPVLSLDPFTAILPLLGPVLAWRAALEGSLFPIPLALLFLSHGGWTFLVLHHSARLLDREEIRLGFDPASLLDREHTPPGRRALFMGVLLVFGILVFAPILQGAFGEAGLPLSLVLLVLLPALVLPRLLHIPTERAFPLALPRPANLPALLLAGGGLLLFATGYIPLQDFWLPLPPELLKGLERALSPSARAGLPLLLLTGALLPGICEEFLFRGPLLSSFRAQWGNGKALVLSSLLFAAAHFSVHRFVPTMAAGLVFGALALRTRNLLWPVLCHTLYNGSLLLLGRGVLQGIAWDRLFSPAPAADLLRLGAGFCLVISGVLLARKETPRTLPFLSPEGKPKGRFF